MRNELFHPLFQRLAFGTNAFHIDSQDGLSGRRRRSLPDARHVPRQSFGAGENYARCEPWLELA